MNDKIEWAIKEINNIPVPRGSDVYDMCLRSILIELLQEKMK
jgi:hypothetical protein